VGAGVWLLLALFAKVALSGLVLYFVVSRMCKGSGMNMCWLELPKGDSYPLHFGRIPKLTCQVIIQMIPYLFSLCVAHRMHKSTQNDTKTEQVRNHLNDYLTC
jgi:hypothetical protein